LSAPTSHSAKSQVIAVLSSHSSRHDAPAAQVTCWQSLPAQSKVQLELVSHSTGQLPELHLKLQLLPGPQVHWLPAHSPSHCGLLLSHSTGQLPDLHWKLQLLPGPQVHWLPAH
jgi:hypothetical protein